MFLATDTIPIDVQLGLRCEMRVVYLDVDVILTTIRTYCSRDPPKTFEILPVDLSSHGRELDSRADTTFPSVEER